VRGTRPDDVACAAIGETASTDTNWANYRLWSEKTGVITGVVIVAVATNA